MTKYIGLLIFAFLPLSVFAGTDTDQICGDDFSYGRQIKNISVNYPNEKVKVSDIWKVIENQKGISEGKNFLYYVVNIETDVGFVKRSELYRYDCTSKKPKQLLILQVNRSGTYYNIDTINGKYVTLHAGEGGIADAEFYEVSVYDTIWQKKLFTIQNSGVFPSYASISGFVSGRNGWYLYFEENGTGNESAIYQINKKNKKITKL